MKIKLTYICIAFVCLTAYASCTVTEPTTDAPVSNMRVGFGFSNGPGVILEMYADGDTAKCSTGEVSALKATAGMMFDLYFKDNVTDSVRKSRITSLERELSKLQPSADLVTCGGLTTSASDMYFFGNLTISSSDMYFLGGIAAPPGPNVTFPVAADGQIELYLDDSCALTCKLTGSIAKLSPEVDLMINHYLTERIACYKLDLEIQHLEDEVERLTSNN